MATMSAGTTALEPPRPEPDEITRFFWEGVDQHRLLILRCNSCRHYVHLPRDVCPFCLSTDLSPGEVSGRGVLETFTIPLQPFHPWFRERVPYVLAVVELDEQEDLKLVTNIVDTAEESVRCGMRVHVVFREISPGLTLPLFVPDDEAEGGAS
jgi:uncharacterized protein